MTKWDRTALIIGICLIPCLCVPHIYALPQISGNAEIVTHGGLSLTFIFKNLTFNDSYGYSITKMFLNETVFSKDLTNLPFIEYACRYTKRLGFNILEVYAYINNNSYTEVYLNVGRLFINLDVLIKGKDALNMNLQF